MRSLLTLEASLAQEQMPGYSLSCLEKKVDQKKLSWRAKDAMILRKDSKYEHRQPVLGACTFQNLEKLSWSFL